MKSKLIKFSLLAILMLLFTCTKLDNDYEPKGMCVYGPPGLKACVNTTESDCKDNFKGEWYEGQECP